MSKIVGIDLGIANSILSFPRRRESNSDQKFINWIPAFAGMTER